MNQVKESDKGYKGPVITNEKESPNETEAKYQSDGDKNLCLPYQAETEGEKAKYQADGNRKLCLQHQAENEEDKAKYQAKTGIGTNGRQEDKETETGAVTDICWPEKETKAKHQADNNRSLGLRNDDEADSMKSVTENGVRMPAKDLAEVDGSIKTLTEMLAEVDNSIKTLTEMLAKDTKTLTGKLARDLAEVDVSHTEQSLFSDSDGIF